MSSGIIILFELSLVLGLALVFGVRELRNLRRYDRERAARAMSVRMDTAQPRGRAEGPASSDLEGLRPSAGDAGHPER